ncbi:MAG: hypothetical protein GOVbin4162_79 [Prokaryotic dsDNA virus sp.]|nr:MAG: hypothetical protein GOVbin4162_79 [Prokaryotic dsDNA virus sp.]|tara:strand:- start:2044 stop:2943 length:900 start_codon:yes stop_codon:yes gene_type:complete
MNIVYRLVNKREDAKPKYYIGMKQECDIVSIEGEEIIWCNREDKEYWSSSASVQYFKDFSRGDRFSVEVLFKGSREAVAKKEVELLEQVDAANNPLYYNLCNQSLHTMAQDKVVNRYGETLKDVANCKSSSSKRDRTAESLGFKDSSFLAEFIYKQSLKGYSFAKISRDLGRHRHFAKVYISKQDMSLFNQEINNTDPYVVRKMYALGATLTKISKTMNIGYFSARRLLGCYLDKGNRRFLVATDLGYTKDELGCIIVRMFLEGKSLGDISKELKIQEITTRRYFHSCLRERLKASDFE